mgnify:CR=1 FL=1
MYLAGMDRELKRAIIITAVGVPAILRYLEINYQPAGIGRNFASWGSTETSYRRMGRTSSCVITGGPERGEA